MPYPATFKQRLLQWLRRCNCTAFYDSNNYKLDAYATYDCIAACANDLVETGDNPFADVERLSNAGNFLFGFFGYDLKNKIERLHSDKPNRTGFPDACFFVADVVFELKENDLVITGENAIKIFEEVNAVPLVENEPAALGPIHVKHRTDKKQYIENVEALRRHIEDGDFYEINYCQEFYADNADLQPDALFEHLKRRSAAPFSAYLKFHHLHLISSSPERFLKRLGGTLVSQPIKGTIKRDLTNPRNDEALKIQLRDSEKEKAENVMIVDLMRNDFNRVSTKGSVTVKELFGIYSFPTLHHLISTVECELRPGIGLEEIFRAAFPMGSMTGAPKVEVMKAIEFYEDTARGAFSGAAGYITPNGDFDFNVIIRTVLWNATTNYLSYHTGGAITFDSNAEDEYAECLLKAQAMSDILTATPSVEN